MWRIKKNNRVTQLVSWEKYKVLYNRPKQRYWTPVDIQKQYYTSLAKYNVQKTNIECKQHDYNILDKSTE